jgi:hypothetical protein
MVPSREFYISSRTGYGVRRLEAELQISLRNGSGVEDIKTPVNLIS